MGAIAITRPPPILLNAPDCITPSFPCIAVPISKTPHKITIIPMHEIIDLITLRKELNALVTTVLESAALAVIFIAPTHNIITNTLLAFSTLSSFFNFCFISLHLFYFANFPTTSSSTLPITRKIAKKAICFHFPKETGRKRIMTHARTAAITNAITNKMIFDKLFLLIFFLSCAGIRHMWFHFQTF